MTLDQLITDLQTHAEKNPDEKDFSLATISWVEKYREFAFVKENLSWHIVASLWITNPSKTKILLMYHKRFQMWTQFWGHCDGDIDVRNVALREFHEESWIVFEPEIFPNILSVQLWNIRERTSSTGMFQPEHIHYDILYLGYVSEDVSFARQESEVDDIQWFEIEWIEKYIGEKRMLNMIEKIKSL